MIFTNLQMLNLYMRQIVQSSSGVVVKDANASSSKKRKGSASKMAARRSKQGRASSPVGMGVDGGSGLADGKTARAALTPNEYVATSDSDVQSADRDEFADTPNSAEESDHSYQQKNTEARNEIGRASAAGTEEQQEVQQEDTKKKCLRQKKVPREQVAEQAPVSKKSRHTPLPPQAAEYKKQKLLMLAKVNHSAE
jgi:hypothetical protein